MSNLAETILRDVPICGRIYTGGNCLDELVLKKDVEAALTAAMDPALTERAGEVLEGVSDGPWRVGNLESYEMSGLAFRRVYFPTASEDEIREAHIRGEDCDANARFIAWCREGVPALLAQNAALRAEVRKSAMDAVSAGCQAQEAWEAQKAAEARAERLEAALRLLHDNVVLAFPALANLGPVANARAALSTTEEGHE